MDSERAACWHAALGYTAAESRAAEKTASQDGVSFEEWVKERTATQVLLCCSIYLTAS
jgi:hypothetical protein